MKKNRGTLNNSKLHLVLSIFLAFILVIVLLPNEIIAQNLQQRSSPQPIAQDESSESIPPPIINTCSETASEPTLTPIPLQHHIYSFLS